jgi:hypothetical protein
MRANKIDLRGDKRKQFLGRSAWLSVQNFLQSPLLEAHIFSFVRCAICCWCEISGATIITYSLA